MSNIIRFNETSPNNEWLVMSNQGTDCFLDLLIAASDIVERTGHQKKLLSFLKEQRSINEIAPGTAGFDVIDMPWKDDSLSADVQFLLQIIETAESDTTFEKLPYEAEKTIVFPWLVQFAGMIEQMMPGRDEIRINQGGKSVDRPITTLFMLMSVDGKISTGATDELDVDKDFPNIDGVKEGLHQYYEIEQTTDLWSFNTGRVQAKMGVNQKELPGKTPVSFVILDNHHLKENGVRYFCALSKLFILITSNKDHPAFCADEANLRIIYQQQPDLRKALSVLKNEYGCERLTVQCGGTVNSLFLREKLFDYVDIVVAPVLIGGKNTATLIDGDSIASADDLSKLGVLELTDCSALQDSYVRLRYKVIG